jgi:hypothetical protein
MSFHEKKFQKLIDKSKYFSALYRNIKQKIKRLNNCKIFKYENKQIQDKRQICDKFAKHFSSIYSPKSSIDLENFNFNSSSSNSEQIEKTLSEMSFDMTDINRELMNLDHKNPTGRQK